MDKFITSIHNALIKEVTLLSEKSRQRKKLKCFVVEGQREIYLAMKGGLQIQTLLYAENIASEASIRTIKKKLPSNAEFIKITAEIYKKLAYRSSTEGMIAVFETKTHDLNSVKITKKDPLILVAEAPEKPGNIGALLRTADAAMVDLVLIANPRTDLYNPNIIRSSVGTVFTNAIATGSTQEIIAFLKENGIQILCAALENSTAYHLEDFRSPTAIVVGTESTGLSDEWLDSSTSNIVIPMSGEIDSMNVSVAAGILIFEAKRQRGF